MHSWIKYRILVALAWLASQISHAQLPSTKFEVITSKEGLPSNTVFSATRDRKGFMWFGTRLCPVRYDGASFQSFKSIRTTFVNGIARDKDDNIWFASSQSKVCKIDGITQEITQLPNTTFGGNFYIDSKGQGWYSDTKGIYRVDLKTGKQSRYPLNANLYVWHKGSFIEDKNHTLWVLARDNGLFKYDPQKDSMICMLGADSKIAGRNDSSMVFNKGCVDKNGILWLGTYNQGLIRYDPADNSFRKFKRPDRENVVLSVCEGFEDNGNHFLWVGDTHGLGIFRPDTEKFYFFDNLFPLPYDVYDIFRDTAEGTVWACTSEGILKYSPHSNRVKTIMLPPASVKLPVRITYVLHDRTQKDGNIFYLGLSHTGILRWNKKTNEFQTIHLDGEPETRFMTQHPDGTILIGTNRWDNERPGVFLLDPSTQNLLITPLSINVNKVFSWPSFEFGFFDDKDRLWIGKSDEGIRVFDRKTGRDVTAWNDSTNKALVGENNLVNAILYDTNKRILLGSYQGIFIADERQRSFVRFDTAKEIINREVNSLLQDGEGNIWSARWGSLGEISAEGKLKKELTTNDGFQDTEVKGLAQDYKGNIWIGNGEGLYCYTPSTKRLQRYTTNDGLVNNNTCDRVFASGNGKEILVTHRNSFNVIDIDLLLNPISPPTLAISNFKVQGRDYFPDLTKPIVLKRSQNAFNVDFIALNFRRENDNQYAYYLEGLEENWKFDGANHKIQYTNLGPGNYTLHLKAGDAFGNWNDQTLRVKIEVLPAFYETWWFRIAVFFFIIGFLYCLYLYRISQLLRLHQMRNRISADLHDELGASLSGISIVGALAQKRLTQQHPSTPFVERMVEEVQLISSSLDDIVWSISPKNDELSNLLARMTRYSSELFEAKEINYTFIIPDQLAHVRLSMEQRRNFYLIFKEAVNNLVKYSKCTLASVKVHIEQKIITLIIEDNGIGFNPGAQNDRNGLMNMKARAKTLKGSLLIKSAPGMGTCITLEFNTR